MSNRGNLAVFIPHVGCPNKCSFCNQNAITSKSEPITAGEVAEICTEYAKNDNAKSCEFAFFGGSFTAIDKEYMHSLLQVVSPYVKSGVFSGIRFSTRPDALDKGVMSELSLYPITAIELGCQSMDNEVLRANFRGHTADDIINASELIKAAGYSFGVQMMTGLFTDNEITSLQTAKKLIALSPNTVRIYPTVVLPDTYLAELYSNGKYKPPSAEESIPLVADLIELFENSKVSVIRVGLHAEEAVENSMLAGAYHPAFRELCDNYRILKKIKSIINNKSIQKGDIIIYVPKGKISAAVGQKKKNIVELKELGYNAKVREAQHLSGMDIEIEYL